MKRMSLRITAFLLVLATLLAGCASGADVPKTEAEEDSPVSSGRQVEKAEKQDIGDLHLRDNDHLYENDDDTSVVTMYLTVSRGNEAENTDHSWQEINTYSAYDYDRMGIDRYQVAALLQVGDEVGPLEGELGFGEVVPNATVQIRGQTSTRAAQKNYKIEIKKGKGTWRDQRTINLNKHQGDGLRFRNKLMYDLLEGVPQLMSLRTQFVHLYVRDLTAFPNARFVDYGLYTQVEQLNGTGMKAHRLDADGHLYKINHFEFYRYADTIMTEDSPGYDKTAFEYLLETKGNTDHTKLIEMLDAVNDYSIPVDTVLEQYFDTENICYWLAFMILTGNLDTESRNVYIYSPLNSDKWYFIPWDNDVAFKKTERELSNRIDGGSWQAGISNYWGNVLFQRCLKSKAFKEELDAAVEDLKAYLSPERLNAMTAAYAETVKPYAFSMPDMQNLGVTAAQYDTIAAAIPDEVEENYQSYLESWEKPMPFYIGVPTLENGKLCINWDTAYDFDAEDISYSLELARDYTFRNPLYAETGLWIPEVELDLGPLAPGQYFVRVRATNSSGHTQGAFDYYVFDGGKAYDMKSFYITEDGKIIEDVYVEG